MKVPVNLFFGLIMCIYCDAQLPPTFFKSYEGFSGRAIVQTPDGGFALAGSDVALGATYDFCMMKTDSLGTVEWSKRFGGSSIDFASAIIQTYDQGFVMAGQTESFGAGATDMYAIKTDPSGDTLWTRTFGLSGNDAFGYVIETADSNLLFAGWTQSFGGFRTVLIKTNQNGNLIWSKTYLAPGGWAFHPKCISPTSDNAYMITGTVDNFYMLKIDTAGNVLWDKQYFLGYSIYPGHATYCARQTSDSGFIVSGSLQLAHGGGTAMEVFKTDSMGSIIWQNAYGDTALNLIDYGSTIDILADGSYILSGMTSAINAGQTALLKINPNGTLVWAKAYGNAWGSHQECRSLLLGDSSIALIANMDLFGTDPFKMLRADRNGQVGCLEDTLPVVVCQSNLTAVAPNGSTTDVVFIIGSSTQILQMNEPIALIYCLETQRDEVEISSAGVLEIFPNPGAVHSSFTVSLPERKTGRKIEIFNAVGIKVYADLLESATQEVNCRLEAGIYQVVLTDSDRSFAEKLVIY